MAVFWTAAVVTHCAVNAQCQQHNEEHNGPKCRARKCRNRLRVDDKHQSSSCTYTQNHVHNSVIKVIHKDSCHTLKYCNLVSYNLKHYHEYTTQQNMFCKKKTKNKNNKTKTTALFLRRKYCSFHCPLKSWAWNIWWSPTAFCSHILYTHTQNTHTNACSWELITH